MRTVLCSDCHGGVYLARGGVYLPRGVCTCLGVYLPRGMYILGGCTCPGAVYLPEGCTCKGVYLPGVYLPRGMYMVGGCTCQGVYLQGGVPARGVPAPGVPARGERSDCPEGCLRQCMLGYNPLWREFLTHASENITFPQLRLFYW